MENLAEGNLEKWNSKIKQIRPTIEKIFFKHESFNFDECFTKWIHARVIELINDCVIKSFDVNDDEDGAYMACSPIIEVKYYNLNFYISFIFR